MTRDADTPADAPALDDAARQRFTRNVVWNYAAGFTSIFGLVLLYPLAIALAGVEKYGMWVLAFGATQLLVLTDFGLGDGIVRQLGTMLRRGDSRLELRRFVSVSMTVFTALALVLASAYALLLPLYLDTVDLGAISDPERRAVLLCGAAAVLLAVSSRGTNAVLWALDRQDIERKSAVVGLLVRVAGYAVTFAVDGGLIGVVVAEAVGAVVTPSACGIAVYRRFAGPVLSRAAFARHAPPLLRLGSTLFAGSLATLAALQLPLFIVGSSLGLAASTAFGAIMRVYQSARLVNSWMANPFIHGFTSGSLTEAAERARWCFAATGCVALSMSAVVVGLAPDLMTAWLGASFAVAAPALAATALGMLADALIKPSTLLVNLRGAPWRISALNVVSLAATVVGVSFAARTAELGWIAVAATGAPLLLAPLYVREAALLLGGSPLPRRPVGYLAAAVVTAAALGIITLISQRLPAWPAVLTVAGVGLVILACGALGWQRRRHASG